MKTYLISARYGNAPLATLEFKARTYQEAVARMVAYLRMEFDVPANAPVTISCRF
jgi:hypothetical protein